MQSSPVRRALARAALTGAAVLAATAPAVAHTDVESTSPRDGAVLETSPRRVVVTYGEALGAATGARVVVGGRDIAGTPQLDPGDARRLVVPLTAAAPGAHRARWEVVGADGHPLAGAIVFRVRAGAEIVALRRVGRSLTGAAIALRGSLPAA